MSLSLGVIGCGKMAYALVKGLSAIGFKSLHVNDSDPGRGELFATEFGARVLPKQDVIRQSAIILLAVKPQQLSVVMAETRGCWEESKLLVSVAAGIPTSYLEEAAGTALPVVRVMPNTPCLVGQGVSALSPGRHATAMQLEQVQSMFSSVGLAVILEEKYLDAVTAVSGSGPAYVFLTIEAMINAAINIGLDASLARQLVLGTIRGSLAMVEHSGEHPAILREQVCSPAGTTIAGVRQLEARGLRSAFFDAIDQAYRRSLELGKQK